MSCALPCTWWCCTIEPVWAPPRKSLSYVCSGLFRKPNPLFCFVLWYSSCFEVKCWIHTFPKRCSHMAVWILILLDHRGCHDNSFQPTCFSSSGSDLFQHPQDQLKVFSTLFVSSVPKLSLCFAALPPFFQGLIYLNQASIFIVKSLHSFQSMFWSGDPLWRCSWASSSSIFILVFLSGGFNSSFRCWSYLFLLFHISSHVNLLSKALLFIHLSQFISGVLKISRKIRVFHSQSVQDISRLLSHSSHLIQPVQSPLSINCSTVYLLAGPNPQVFSQDLTWLF